MPADHMCYWDRCGLNPHYYNITTRWIRDSKQVFTKFACSRFFSSSVHCNSIRRYLQNLLLIFAIQGFNKIVFIQSIYRSFIVNLPVESNKYLFCSKRKPRHHYCCGFVSFSVLEKSPLISKSIWNMTHPLRI